MLFLLLAAALTGPSSSSAPYVLPEDPGTTVIAILTAGDRVDGYRFGGVPDGLGAYDNNDGTFTLLVNHEIPAAAGIPRAHGMPGAFVTKLTIRKRDFAVLRGEDLVRNVSLLPNTNVMYSFDRLCSADLAPRSAFFDEQTGTGYDGRLYLNGEESPASGHAFAHRLDGSSFDLPRLGRAAWENQVANPASGSRTIVVGLDDSAGGQVYVYIGEKTNSGSDIERAGLMNGSLFGVKVLGYPVETDFGIPNTPFTLTDLGDVTRFSVADLEAASRFAGVTAWQRPEDGAWHPGRPNEFYFATTGVSGPSRLWRLRFDDVADPRRGGLLEMVFDSNSGPRHMDNLTITRSGHLFVQEDLGGVAARAGIWRYDINSGEPPKLLARTLGNNEETSGIIDATDILGDGWVIFTSQPHRPSDAEIVQDGQILAMRLPGRRRSVGR